MSAGQYAIVARSQSIPAVALHHIRHLVETTSW